ncbi:MAG: phospho-N-acetylmuramoyl-pentapeptide-transferase [Clostridiales bacterium]|jgi:phospho-N-acetylmuramoyl-pentapeptide-transferase|nr:phospho-N-acetylmuramoyl-pentapeptide-transferase [Clostridiales bacterium]
MKSEIIIIILSGIIAFGAAMLISPFVIKIMTRIKVGQPILKYLGHHAAKGGTPTMGGFIFVVPAAAVTLCLGYGKLSLMAVLTSAAYAVVGFLDDFIKVRSGKNEGLKPYQKLIGQTGIAAAVAFFAYNNHLIGDTVRIPFFQAEFGLGVFFLPFAVFMFLAVTNSVNLTDGLDGLAGGSGFVSLFIFLIAGILYYFEASYYGMIELSGELFGLSVFAAAYAFSLLGFLWHNSAPAKIMMGDTGSLSLGGALCAIAVFMRNPLLIAAVCVVYIWSSISVIIQVAFFKLTRKRIFKMSPFHHHLELKGLSENKIAVFYTIITVIAGAVGIIGVILNLQ